MKLCLALQLSVMVGVAIGSGQYDGPVPKTYGTSDRRGFNPLNACSSKRAWCTANSATADCTDTAFGRRCQEWLKAFSCRELVDKYRACTECSCAPGTWDAEATEAPARQGKCQGKTSEPCYSELAQWQIDSILKKHNDLRAKHGACPLTYSKTIADYTLGSPGFRKTCSSKRLTHNNPPQNGEDAYGENLAMVSGDKELQDFDPAQSATQWYCDGENCWMYDQGTGSGAARRMTQIVWKGTKEVGCGLCHVESRGMTNVYLMCHYFPAGNAVDEFKENVLEPPVAPSGCAQ